MNLREQKRKVYARMWASLFYGAPIAQYLRPIANGVKINWAKLESKMFLRNLIEEDTIDAQLEDMAEENIFGYAGGICRVKHSGSL